MHLHLIQLVVQYFIDLLKFVVPFLVYCSIHFLVKDCCLIPLDYDCCLINFCKLNLCYSIFSNRLVVVPFSVK